MDFNDILVTIDKGICTIKLNRPDVRNALGLTLRKELKEFFSSVKENDEIKVIVLTGEGKAFSAGGDLSSLKEIDAVKGRLRLQSGHEMIQAIIDLEKPVIAAVNGAAAGAGFSLALACDFIIAKRSSFFVQSFMNVGLVPDLGSIYFLPRLIGRQRALELMLLGDRVTAEQALSLGIINSVVEDESFEDAVYQISSRLAEGPGFAAGLTKKLVNRSVLANINETFELEGFAQGLCFESEDFKEGIRAFFEKRKPRFN